MDKAKVITICGSLKFMDKLMEVSEELELQGNCVLSIIYPTKEDKDNYSKEKLEMFAKLHRQRIMMSDAIFVVNVNNYIGDGVRSEIAYAKELGKEILYLENVDE